MSLPVPIILLPTKGADYATDTTPQTLSGTTSTDTIEIRVNGSTHGVSYSPRESVWSWTGDLSLGENIIQVVAIERGTLNPSLPATIKITLVQKEQFITVSPPTGTYLKRYQDKIEVITSKNPEPQVVGYNFWVSTRSGGIDNTYAKINNDLVTEYSFFEDKTSLLNRSVDTAGNIRVTTITEEVNRIYYYSCFLDADRFAELVDAGLLDPIPFNENATLFFVVSAVIYDPVSGQVTESTYSSEMQGAPLIITTGIRDLPPRVQTDILLTFADELLASNEGIDTKPGTVIRDMMNPISEEMARVYVIQDFLARSLSVSALLDFDDANGDGKSDPVLTSPKKRALQTALFLNNPDEVQRIIDDQFDKLASNVNVFRKDAVPATGTVIFYVETPPIRDMIVHENGIVSTLGDLDAGIPAQNYKLLTTKILRYADKDLYYNAIKKRYELEVPVEALNAGSNGNTDSYTIKTINSGVDSDFLVENPNPISFGSDRESNRELGERIQLAYFVDTGTEGGYVRTAIAVPGVRNVRIEKAGDPLMIRDLDPVRMEHIGGKVDIYIQGKRFRQISDQIAFEFSSIASHGLQQGEIFQVINAVSFQFKTTNINVTAHTPIFEVTRVHNATRGADYDISGYQIIGDGNTIDLDETRPTNASIGLASSDVIRVDYKYRSSDVFILKHQPVDEIISVRGQLSGDLPPENWELVSLEDKLENGGSTIAKDGIRIKYSDSMPPTGFQTITDEPHVMILDKDEPLDFLGADPESIVVKSQDLSVTYTENIDYRIIPGTSTTATIIRMIESGSIQNGQQVLISYNAIENFTVTYSTNALLEDVQARVDLMKHACADVIVKQAIENKIDFVITVVPKIGVANLAFLTSKIQTAVANYISQLRIGSSVTQSEIIRIIQEIPDVSYVVVPFNRMVRADGSFIVRDDIGKTQFQIFNEGVARAYISTLPVLTYKTIDKGGPITKFRGIFEDGVPLILQDNELDVSGGAGRGYIRSDGKIIVSTKDGRIPDNKNYSASYFVYGETGSGDINTASIEYLTVGNFTVIYDQPKSQQQML